MSDRGWRGRGFGCVFRQIAQVVGMLAAERSGDIFFDHFVRDAFPYAAGTKGFRPFPCHVMLAWNSYVDLFFCRFHV